MGNIVQTFMSTFLSILIENILGYQPIQDPTYAVYDQTQIIKPLGRTKDLVCVNKQHNPSALDTVDF